MVVSWTVVSDYLLYDVERSPCCRLQRSKYCAPDSRLVVQYGFCWLSGVLDQTIQQVRSYSS